MSEAGVHVLANCVMLLQQEDFQKIEEDEVWKNHLEKYPSHIYTIARRPRVAIDESSLKLSGGFVSGNFTIRSADGITTFPFCIRNETGAADIKLSAPYPHQIIFAHDADGTQISAAKASLLASLNRVNMGDNLALEVLYIGQSYGVEGSRTSLDRLRKHETLQAIYSRAAAETPDLEVWILLWHITPNTLLMFDGASKDYLVDDKEDDQHLDQVLSAPVSDQQIINLCEAAMIRYFRPEFNIRFKDSFPSPAHSTYAECYSLDLNSISIEVESEDVNVHIWSSAASRASQRHFATFPLHSSAERRSMFEMLIPSTGEWVDMSAFNSEPKKRS